MSDTQPSTASPNDSSAQAPLSRRAWWRLHFSTWIVAGLVLALLTLIVVPGNPDNHELMSAAPLFYEHGWPFVCLDRYYPPPPDPGGPDECFEFLRDWRDKAGLRIALANNEFWLWSKDGFQNDGPFWLESTRWPLEGESLVSVAGLILDLAVAFVILATVVSLYEWWARRRWRYRLHHLLVASFLMAIGLGWWRLSINEWERESQAIEALRNKGLDVSWCHGGPAWLIKLVGPNHLRPFHHVASIDRHYHLDEYGAVGQAADVSSVIDNDLNSIRRWSHLKQLFLSHTRITDATLKNIEGLRELDLLDLQGTRVTDAGLEHLRDLPRLRFLVLSYTAITDAGVRRLTGLPNLRRLYLDNTQITDDVLPSIKALPKLYHLSLNDTKITDAGVPHLKALSGLKSIDLSVTLLTDAGLQDFAGALQLEELQLHNTKVTADGVARLQQALPKCKIKWNGAW